MEFQKIVTLLDTTSDDNDLPRFVTVKWIEVYDQSGRNNYNVNKEIIIKTPMVRSDLHNFSDAYIVVKGIIAVTNPDDAKRNKSVAFENNAPFISSISKINSVQNDNAEDVEYNKNYKKQQVVCGVITQMNQAILSLRILNLLNTRQVLQEILTTLVLVKPVMMQIKLVKIKLKLLFR